MKVLKFKWFDDEEPEKTLCDYVNKYNLEIVSITAYNEEAYTLFYYDNKKKINKNNKNNKKEKVKEKPLDLLRGMPA